MAIVIGGTEVTATAAELNYVDGVSSDIQTQLGAIQSADFTAGTLLIASADTERSTGSTDMVKVKEITLGRGGTIRIKWWHKYINGSREDRHRIYRNGVYIAGTDVGTSSGTYTEETQDVSGWSAGDACQLYYKTKGNGASSSVVKEFRIYAASGCNATTVVTD